MSFSYPDSEIIQINGISQRLTRGYSYGIAGASGAGKSTLIDLILGLLSPTSGEISIDGCPIEGRP